MRRGEARVCVGPRSAVFAPLPDLGLIVIDEEHDASYKQEGDPRYDARHVAERRAEQSGAVLVAGSATPRPESWLRLERLELPERVDGRGAAAGRARARWRASPGALHPRTRDALDAVRVRGEKAIVLLNRRGWSNFLSCRVVRPRLGVPASATCRSCSTAPPRGWPATTAATASWRRRVPGLRLGVGRPPRRGHRAARAASSRRWFDPLPVFRLDSDAAARRGAHRRRAAAASTRRRAGVLVGTQMVAKGHDFPDVTLGVVLDADSTLRFPDFRAEERTFALVAQLAGRSGRGPRGGRVIVQALEPDARALRHAARARRRGLPQRRARAPARSRAIRPTGS